MSGEEAKRAGARSWSSGDVARWHAAGVPRRARLPPVAIGLVAVFTGYCAVTWTDAACTDASPCTPQWAVPAVLSLLSLCPLGLAAGLCRPVRAAAAGTAALLLTELPPAGADTPGDAVVSGVVLLTPGRVCAAAVARRSSARALVSSGDFLFVVTRDGGRTASLIAGNRFLARLTGTRGQAAEAARHVTAMCAHPESRPTGTAAPARSGPVRACARARHDAGRRQFQAVEQCRDPRRVARHHRHPRETRIGWHPNPRQRQGS